MVMNGCEGSNPSGRTEEGKVPLTIGGNVEQSIHLDVPQTPNVATVSEPQLSLPSTPP